MKLTLTKEDRKWDYPLLKNMQNKWELVIPLSGNNAACNTEKKMRIWSLHPKYLDSKGLVALWREALLAKNVLEGKTIGYKNHPQLNRFKQAKRPLEAINQYLSEIYLESVIRSYNFDKQKINWSFKKSKLPVTTGQLN